MLRAFVSKGVVSEKKRERLLPGSNARDKLCWTSVVTS
jgi:hypothetical protein